LAWLHHVLDEPALVVSRLPDSLDTVAARLAGQAGSLTGWSKVCVVKGTFLKGMGSYFTCMAVADTTQALLRKRQAAPLML
jgi:hypothetical protein